MKRCISLITAVVLVMLLLCGCVANTSSDKYTRISYVADPDGMGTDSLELVSSAMEEINEFYEFDNRIYSTQTLNDVNSVATEAVTEGADLFIGTSYVVNHKLLSLLKKSESTLAMIGSSVDEQYPNVVSITFRMEESAFLAGYLAAGMSETGTVAYVGAYDSDSQEQYYGFYTGAKYKNRLINVVSSYTESYNNSLRGKAAAEEVKSKNADVFYVNCGSCALGISELVRGSEVKLILSEQYTVSSDEVIAQSKQYVKNAAFYVIDEFLNGELKAGNYRYGISYGFVDLQLGAGVSEGIKNDVAEIRTMIRTSKIKVPSSEEESGMFLGGNVTLQKNE